MEGENRVNRLKIQRLESRRKTRDIYKVVGCLMPYRLCALILAQLKLSSVRFMQHPVPERLREHHVMDWLALRVAKRSNFWPAADEKTAKNDSGDGHLDLSERLAWEILTNDNNTALEVGRVGSLGTQRCIQDLIWSRIRN